MPYIELDRRFFQWNKKIDGDVDPDAVVLHGLEDKGGWKALLTRRRVVLLAEAGSGKSDEMKEQARRIVASGGLAFTTTVQDVVRYGLSEAVGSADRFREWQSSDRPGWFFIDSIDEAKLDGVRLQTALRRISAGIGEARSRAHVVLSSRYTDWEPTRDLERLNDELPIPVDQTVSPPLTPAEIVKATIHGERRKPMATQEEPFVAVMLSLDKERVRRFADGMGMTNLDGFIEAIKAGNLWRFARRPLDLQWMAEFWRVNRRLGSLEEMLETSLRERLKEPGDRRHQDPLCEDRAFRALERIGAALVLGRKTTIAIPDAEIAITEGAPPIALSEVLPEWSPSDRTALLNRPVFDPATFGRARLHNDNEGVVRGYLTARWLRRVRETNVNFSRKRPL